MREGRSRPASEINLFDEIMDKVLAEVEPLARRELAGRLAELSEAPQRTLVQLADADELVDLAAFVALRLGVHSDTVVRNLFLGGEQTLMLICRAAALDVDAFSAILRMRNRRRRGSAVEPERLTKDYLRIPRPIAERTSCAPCASRSSCRNAASRIRRDPLAPKVGGSVFLQSKQPTGRSGLRRVRPCRNRADPQDVRPYLPAQHAGMSLNPRVISTAGLTRMALQIPQTIDVDQPAAQNWR